MNEDIIQKLVLGKDNTEIVTVEDVEIELRPLTSGELSKLQAIDRSGIKAKVGVKSNRQPDMNDVNVNAGELAKYQTKAMYKAIAWSMGTKEENVENFPVGVPEQIFEHVIRISKLSDKDLSVIKQFRKDE